ncbi:MAG: hypothetical protein H0V80_13275, partial [Acidobacteria bacterium]|nr:hypothetical protein [Acidobacteriota bacterium]
HPFDIGTAASLPFGPASLGWQALDPSYDKSRLVQDTIALLTPATPVIVRMETLRRATAYAATDRAMAERLLAAVRARATKAAATPDEGLRLFDVGYLIETYRQIEGHSPTLAGVRSNTDGYALVRRALELHPDSGAMQFAAALITTTSRGARGTPAHLTHLEKARSGARADAMVARNLATHFGA